MPDSISALAEQKSGKPPPRGQLRVGCQWKVYWNRRTGSEDKTSFVLTSKRHLEHTGHTLPQLETSSSLIIDTIRKVPGELQDLVTALVQCGVTGERTMRRFAESHLHATIEESTFHWLLIQ
jgi:hypothetical protein